MTWEVRQGDAVELMRGISAASVDAIVTDPPYGERVAKWDLPRPAGWHEDWLFEAARVLKPGAPLVAMASRRHLDIIMGALRRVFGDSPARPLQCGAWVHRQGHPTGNPGFLRPEHEPFVVSGLLRATSNEVRALRKYRTPHTLARRPVKRAHTTSRFKAHLYRPNPTGPMAGTVFEVSRNKPGEAVGHPTQKPEAVMEYLTLLAAAPRGLVLDPFCGTGTTGVVALRHGRRFIGVELDARVAEMARRRIGGPLFALADGGRLA